MMRASLIDIMFRHIMVMHESDIESNGPVTLMNADIERISSGLRYMHDIWACTAEIPIALWLLWRQLGIAGIAPIVVAFGQSLHILEAFFLLMRLSLYVNVCVDLCLS